MKVQIYSILFLLLLLVASFSCSEAAKLLISIFQGSNDCSGVATTAILPFGQCFNSNNNLLPSSSISQGTGVVSLQVQSCEFDQTFQYAVRIVSIDTFTSSLCKNESASHSMKLRIEYCQRVLPSSQGLTALLTKNQQKYGGVWEKYSYYAKCVF